jgi:hypothetical protein
VLDNARPAERLVGVPSGSNRRMEPAPLSRMERLVELLGSPQLQYPAIHITGTNGKTSTARIATALLVGAGLSVGTDTSPYLERFNERISWNGEPIADDDLAGDDMEVVSLTNDMCIARQCVAQCRSRALRFALLERTRDRICQRRKDQHISGSSLAGHKGEEGCGPEGQEEWPNSDSYRA